jgi:hypothetical protein
LADRYFVGGNASNSWNATSPTNWAATSGGANNQSIPGPSDNVFLDANSPSSTIAGATITVRSLDCTGFTNTLTSSSVLFIAGGNVVCRLVPEMTYTLSGGSLIFTGTSGFVDLTTAGKTVSVSKTGAGGTLRFQDDVNATGTLTLTSGTIDANNKNVTVPRFSSSNTNTRFLFMRSGTWTLTEAASATVWDTSTSTGLTVHQGTSTVNVSGASSSGTRTLSMNSVAVNHLKISAGTSGCAVSFTNVSCNDLDFTGFSGDWSGVTGCTLAGSLTLAADMTRSITGAFTFTATAGIKTISTAGKTFASFFTFSGAGGTWKLADAFLTANAVTLTAGTLDGNGSALTASSFFSSNANTRGIVLGSGIWTLTSATGWNTATSTGLTLDATNGTIQFTAATATFHTGGLTYNAVAATSGGATLTVNGSLIAASLSVVGAANINLGGAYNWDVASFSPGTSTVRWTGTGDVAIAPNGQAFHAVEINKSSGTATLAGAILCAGSLSLIAGGLDTDGNAVTANAIVFAGRATRTLDLGGSTVTLTGTGVVWDALDATSLTFTAPTQIVVTDDSENDKVIDGGGLEYNDLRLTGSGTGAFVIRGGNKWNEFRCDTPPHTLKFQPGTIQRVATFAVNGEEGSLMTLESEVEGEPWGLFLYGESSTHQYLSVQDCRAS